MLDEYNTLQDAPLHCIARGSSVIIFPRIICYIDLGLVSTNGGSLHEIWMADERSHFFFPSTEMHRKRTQGGVKY